MRRADPSTWADNFPGDGNTGICPIAGAPHSDFAWYVRSQSAVLEVFRKIWGVDELITSFDAVNVFRPWTEALEMKTRGGWLHLDQNSYGPAGKRGKHCIQGLVTLLDANGSTGSLVVVPGSQNRHQELCDRAKCATGDFVPLQHYGVALDEVLRDSQPTLVCARAGDLVLWDSRTVHANTPALGEPRHKADELLRMVCYTCMTPRAWASDNTIRARQLAYEQDVGGTHWPHEFRARAAGGGGVVRRFTDATEAVQLLIGQCPPVGRPSDEAMMAMAKANELEEQGDIAGAKEWVDKAIALGHNCLEEFGGWK